MTYLIQEEKFQGPLDLLLKLVEKNELEISEISLAKVTGEFLDYIQHNQVQPIELADFLLVASKLIYIKSKLLIPDLQDEEMESGSNLEDQLKRYQMFFQASQKINDLWIGNNLSHARQKQFKIKPKVQFDPPQNFSLNDLPLLMWKVIKKIEPVLRLPKVGIKRAVSIQERIADLFTKIKKQTKISFTKFIKQAEHKEDVVVSFLALLELIKQRFVLVDQDDLFADISVKTNKDAPNINPLAKSFN